MGVSFDLDSREYTVHANIISELEDIIMYQILRDNLEINYLLCPNCAQN